MMASLDQVRIGAGVTLLVIFAAALLSWPLPALGVGIDPETGFVLAVADDSAGAQAGLQVGDQIVAFYGHPWASVNRRLLIVPLPWREGTPSPMTLLRDGQRIALTLQAERPGITLQVDKTLRTLVALVCWATGLALGTSHQRHNRETRWAAWFWVLLGGALGVLPLVDSVSYVLTAAVLWVLITLLAPTAVMMHVWYPSRPVSPTLRRGAWRWWLVAIGTLQLLVLGLAVISRSTARLLAALDTSIMLVFLVCFGLSALILGRVYRTTTVAHIRRQIRLVAVACVVVVCAWTMLMLGDGLAPQRIGAIPPVTLTVVTVLVPLAYLYGGIGEDLFRVDVVARQVGVHGGKGQERREQLDYRRLQQIQEQTAARIAVELHNEVVNVNVRFNIAAIERLLAQDTIDALELKAELETLLETETSTATLLPLICRQLRPAYTGDPLGLVTSLRRATEHLGSTWHGRIRLEVEQAPVPVDREMHRELVLIAREAMTNAIKHAGAREIVVALRFPAAGDEPLRLTVSDNGTTQVGIAAKAGHMGLHFMRDCAATVGATVTWHLRETGGVEVRVVAPLAGRPSDPLLGALPLGWDDDASAVAGAPANTGAPGDPSRWPQSANGASE